MVNGTFHPFMLTNIHTLMAEADMEEGDQELEVCRETNKYHSSDTVVNRWLPDHQLTPSRDSTRLDINCFQYIESVQLLIKKLRHKYANCSHKLRSHGRPSSIEGVRGLLGCSGGAVGTPTSTPSACICVCVKMGVAPFDRPRARYDPITGWLLFLPRLLKGCAWRR